MWELISDGARRQLLLLETQYSDALQGKGCYALCRGPNVPPYYLHAPVQRGTVFLPLRFAKGICHVYSQIPPRSNTRIS